MPAAPTRKVLLIDDDDLVAGSLCQHLVRQGCDVDVALQSATADSLMRAARYEVVLVDPYLTGGVHRNSAELIASIRELQPAAAIIVLTGYGSPALLRIAEERKITAFLNKPQPVTELGRTVLRLTSQETADRAGPKQRDA